MKVLLAVDGSGCALRATSFLIRLIDGWRETDVQVLNVQGSVRYVGLLSDERQHFVEQWQRESGEEATAAARAILAEAKVPWHLSVLCGDPATVIVELARKLSCDLIVMGTRGMGVIGGLALGSVASKVLHLADVPVTLVK